MAASTYRRRSGSAGTLSGARRDLAIQIDGLVEFRRALRSIAPDADRQFSRPLRDFAKRARAKAQSNAPVSPRPKMVKGNLVAPGSLRNSIGYYVRQNSAGLVSKGVPYARAHEWGTSGAGNSQVQPRGVPIKIERSQMLGNAVYFYRDALGYDLANLVNKVARQNGIETAPTVRQSRWGGGRVISSSN